MPLNRDSRRSTKPLLRILAFGMPLIVNVTSLAETNDGGSSSGWRLHKQDATEPTEEQREAMRQLESLAYVSGSVSAGESSGVIRRDRERAQPGLNFYTSGHGPEAILCDMDGKILQ